MGDDDNERMIRDLAAMRGIGAEGATLLVREAFAREFANRQALGAYAGLTGTPFSSGGMQREQGIGKDGNRRRRALMVEIAWFWLRFQPDSALAKWFRERVGQATRAHVQGHDRCARAQASHGHLEKYSLEAG